MDRPNAKIDYTISGDKEEYSFLIDVIADMKTRAKASIALRLTPYYKDSQLAHIIGVTRQTIWNWRQRYPEFIPSLQETAEVNKKLGKESDKHE